MGTRLVIVAERASTSSAEEATEAALREVERVERLLSTWDSATALSRLNRSPPDEPVEPRPELATLLREVESWARRTGHAFDPTIGALVDAWDLRGAGRVPNRAERIVALSNTGRGAFSFQGRFATRHSVTAWIDSGGFGKGAALRSVQRRLQSGPAHGGQRLLVDLGGQVLVDAPFDAPWQIEVAHPSRRHAPVFTLAVPKGSVATSGTSERPGHLLDPRTGFPVDPWGSVTVVADDALEADVLSTALYVMGPVDGFAWALGEGVAALFLEERLDTVTPSWTPAMEHWFAGSSRAQTHTPAQTPRTPHLKAYP